MAKKKKGIWKAVGAFAEAGVKAATGDVKGALKRAGAGVSKLKPQKSQDTPVSGQAVPDTQTAPQKTQTAPQKSKTMTYVGIGVGVVVLAAVVYFIIKR